MARTFNIAQLAPKLATLAVRRVRSLAACGTLQGIGKGRVVGDHPQPLVYAASKKPSQQTKPCPQWFWFSIFFSIASIAAIVLLSKDMKHLHRIEERLGLITPRVSQAELIPSRGFVKPEVLVGLPPSVSRQPLDTTVAGFVRRWVVTGPNLCAAYRSAGIHVGEWRQSAFDEGTFECTFDSVAEAGQEVQEGSLFIVVRGRRDGTLSSVRVKLVDPQTDPSGDIASATLNIFEVTLKETTWEDLSPALSKIRTLREVDLNSFASDLRFVKELSNENSFNFILTIRPNEKMQRQVASYFSAEGWLPPADIGVLWPTARTAENTSSWPN